MIQNNDTNNTKSDFIDYFDEQILIYKSSIKCVDDDFFF